MITVPIIKQWLIRIRTSTWPIVSPVATLLLPALVFSFIPCSLVIIHGLSPSAAQPESVTVKVTLTGWMGGGMVSRPDMMFCQPPPPPPPPPPIVSPVATLLLPALVFSFIPCSLVIIHGLSPSAAQPESVTVKVTLTGWMGGGMVSRPDMMFCQPPPPPPPPPPHQLCHLSQPFSSLPWCSRSYPQGLIWCSVNPPPPPPPP